MRKIINGKMYDTETAKEIVQLEKVGSYNEFIITEILYQKKSGEFFIYREMIGDGDCYEVFNWVLNNIISPLSIEQAKEWVLRTDDVDLYVRLFGEVEE